MVHIINLPDKPTGHRISYSMYSRIFLVIGILCISIYPVIVRDSIVSGLSIALYRMAVAAIVLWLLVLLRKSWDSKVLLYWKGVSICGLIFASDIVAWNYSIQLSSATQGSLLTNLAPIWVGIGSFLFLPQKPGRLFWIGVVVAFLGMVVLLGPSALLSMQFDLGFLLGIVSGLLYASYILYSKKILEKVNVLSFMAVSNSVASVYLFIVALLFGQPVSGFTVNEWISFAVLGIVSQVLGWLSLSYALQYIEAQRVSLSLLSQAVITGILAWIFIDEIITLQMILGGCIILIGIGVTFLKRRKKTVES